MGFNPGPERRVPSPNRYMAVARFCFCKNNKRTIINDVKETTWMEIYEHDCDMLEDILYHRLQDLWAPLTDSMKVFDAHGAAQPICAQKVWEALLAAFPLDHKRMQTVLLAREIARMIRWDGDSKSAVNHHFASVTELHRSMGYIGNLSIEDVLKSVLMATRLKASTNSYLRAAYHKVLDDLDDSKDLSFALFQDACARQFRHYPDDRRSTGDIDERHPAERGRDHPGTPRRHPGSPGEARQALTKPSSKALDDAVVAYLCNFLDENHEKPWKVLKAACLTPKTDADWHTADAVNTEPSPLQDSFGVRQTGDLLGPPHP